MKARNRKTEKAARSDSGRVHAGQKSARKPLPYNLWFVLIFAGAFLVRLIYLLQIQSIPLFYNLPGDPRTYDDWAQRIAAGDWLGQGVFYQAPLYPYVLGFLQTILGHDLWTIRLAQIFLGSLSCALIFLAGRRLISREAGIAAGVILAGYAPAIFFDGLIEKSVLDLFLLALLLALVSLIIDKPAWPLWLAAGIVVALLGLSRENALVLVVVVTLWIALYFRSDSARTRLRWAAIFFAGLLLVLLPVGLRNYTVGGEFKLTTSQFGPNFYIGNNPAADGTYWSIRKLIGESQFEGKDSKRLAERATGRQLTAGEVSDYWFGKSLEFIQSQPGNWLALTAKKWLMVWNSRELEDSDDFYIYRQWSWLLNVLGTMAHFGILAPMAAAGLWLTRHQWRRLWPLYAMIIALAASVAAFYVFGRYRYPLVPVLALFAGAAVAELWRRYKKGEWHGAYAACAAFVISAAVVNWPIYNYRGPWAGGYNNLSNAFYKQGKVDMAISAALIAIEREPEHGVAHYNLGNLYAGQGKFELAQRHFQEAVRIYPNFADAHANLGQLLAERGDLDAGVKHMRRSIDLDPSVARAHLNLGVILAKQGRTEAAVQSLEAAVGWAPNSAEYRYALGSVYAELGRFDDAERAFKDTLILRRDFAPAHESLARLLSSQGKREEALGHYQEALRLMKRGSGSQPGR
jgi:tetratricopeptide (TPR) repeat protein